MVYIREAHPTDGWHSKANEREKILITQPKTLQERNKVAKKMCSTLKITLPPLVDSIDNKVNNAYNAAPDRLYLIGKNGKVLYKSERGPRGFKPKGLEAAIKKVVGKKVNKNTQ